MREVSDIDKACMISYRLKLAKVSRILSKGILVLHSINVLSEPTEMIYKCLNYKTATMLTCTIIWTINRGLPNVTCKFNQPVFSQTEHLNDLLIQLGPNAEADNIFSNVTRSF